MNPFVERHAQKIAGVLTCFDRVVITGIFPEICHSDALARYLTQREFRLFGYPRWAEPFRHQSRAHAELLLLLHRRALWALLYARAHF